MDQPFRDEPTHKDAKLQVPVFQEDCSIGSAYLFAGLETRYADHYKHRSSFSNDTVTASDVELARSKRSPVGCRYRPICNVDTAVSEERAIILVSTIRSPASHVDVGIRPLTG